MLYLNHNPDAYWKILRRRSKAWRNRDKVILETVHTYGTCGHFPGREDFTGYDLDRDATTFLIVDQVTSNQRGFDSNPTNSLNVEVMRFLASTVPSLALKSCWANKASQNNTSGYQVSVLENTVSFWFSYICFPHLSRVMVIRRSVLQTGTSKNIFFFIFLSFAFSFAFSFFFHWLI